MSSLAGATLADASGANPMAATAAQRALADMAAQKKNPVMTALNSAPPAPTPAPMNSDAALDVGETPTMMMRVDGPLRLLMGGKKYCRREELTHEVLFALAMSQDLLKEVKMLDVTVQTLAGNECVVRMDDTDCSVQTLKCELEKFQGTRRDLQQFYTESMDGELANSYQFEGSASVVLSVLPAPEWNWDASSLLVKSGTYTICGPGNAVATFLFRGYETEDHCDFEHCLMTDKVMEEGIHTISFKDVTCLPEAELFPPVPPGLEDTSPCLLSCTDYGIRVGAVPDGTSPEQGRVGWYFDLENGRLRGQSKTSGSHGNRVGSRSGRTRVGQVVTLQADLDNGTLKVWVDSVPRGPGFTGLSGKLKWGLSCLGPEDFGVDVALESVHIVPNPELEPWHEWDGERVRFDGDGGSDDDWDSEDEDDDSDVTTGDETSGNSGSEDFSCSDDDDFDDDSDNDSDDDSGNDDDPFRQWRRHFRHRDYDTMSDSSSSEGAGGEGELASAMVGMFGSVPGADDDFDAEGAGGEGELASAMVGMFGSVPGADDDFGAEGAGGGKGGGVGAAASSWFKPPCFAFQKGECWRGDDCYMTHEVEGEHKEGEAEEEVDQKTG
jgi:hypothetical protein